MGDIVERSVEMVSCKHCQAFVTRFKTSRNRGALWRKVRVKVISKRPENCLDRALWPSLRRQQGRGASASRLRRWRSSVYSRILKRGDGLRETYLALVLVSHIQCSRHVYMNRQSSSLGVSLAPNTSILQMSAELGALCRSATTHKHRSHEDRIHPMTRLRLHESSSSWRMKEGHRGKDSHTDGHSENYCLT